MNRNKYTFIDLFSGAGGLSAGFEMAGFKSVLAIDNWQDSLDTYSNNIHGSVTLCEDLSKLNIKETASKLGLLKVDLIIGGPPCQGFSVAGKRIIDDLRNKLYKSFVSFVDYFRPRVFVMENVPNILTIGNGIVKNSIISDFESLGYKVVYKVLMASDYGVPQNRRRSIFVGTISGGFVFPEPLSESKISVYQAISDLGEYSVQDGGPYPFPIQSNYQRWARSNSQGLYNHQVTEHTEKTKKIISLVPDGGNYKDLPEEFQNTRKVHIAWTRLNSTKPSITIDTGHRHHFHYKYNRIPTVRESARLQSFPDNYIFFHSKTSQYRQVGNAVPPLMAKAIAQEIMKVLDNNIR
ncbi:MAG: DNA cytosine methyltransferase [Bacteroidales bacterium]|nr:DNA cytosine methyltransferase [Bacteroidales bacterium]MDY6002604.1 DNA cytosine methyltransferase [Candidatus Cryptobacteroides sp.]